MMNVSEYSNLSARGHEDCGINHSMVSVLVASLYFLIFIPALVLNVTVIWVLLQLKTESTFMVYLKNLVAADLLMTLTMPIKAASKLPGAALSLRSFTCQFASILFYHSMHISIILMGLISLDRFFKIVRPWGSLLGQSLLFGRAVSIAAWIMLLGTATLPNMIMTSGGPVDQFEEPSESSSNLCKEMKSQEGKDFHEGVNWALNLLFWIVLILIGFCYACIARTVVRSYSSSGSTNSRGKHKTEVKVFIVLAVFLVCFAPDHIIGIQLQVQNKHSCMRESLNVAKEFTLCLAATNVCLDPLIYFFLCKSFRENLSDLGILRRFFSSSLRDL